jgi:uncharacterized membrane protein
MAPFHLAFVPFFQGIGRVFAWTSPEVLVLYGGILLVPVFGAVVAELGHSVDCRDERSRALALAAVAALVVAAAATGRPTLVVLTAALVALSAWLLREAPFEERPAVALATLGIFLFLVPEVVYIIDSYGERLHRMNTVFKSYIQAWPLLAAALPTLVTLLSRRLTVRVAVVAALALVALPHPGSLLLRQFSGAPLSLDGLSWMPGDDRVLVEELRRQPRGTFLIEAVGGAYSEFGRLSANSGVPAYLGWENHELVWRGHEITELTTARRGVVEELYGCGDPGRVRELVELAGVHLVAVGTLERKVFAEQALAAVAAAGEVELREGASLLVRFAWPAEVAATEPQP